MYRSKKDVDKHVETLTSKLSLKEFNSRTFSIARLYFDVGDYASCIKYVEQYLACKDKNAAAHKLLGQAFQKSGQKEKALEQYKISLDIDSTQTNTILDICELLADDEVTIDPGRAKYWCERAEAIFPKHTTTFRLREKLLNKFNPDPEALVKLLKAELLERPKEALLHAHLLKHYLNSNQIKEAFEHSCNVEFENNYFSLNYDWYEIIAQVLKSYTFDFKDWLYQLLLLTVKERLCLLSLSEMPPSGSSKSLTECNDLLFHYDQAIENVARVGAPSGHSEFHSYLLQHHKGQLAFHTATFLLKKAKKDLMNWRESTRLADPLMLIAWQIVPMDSKVNWLFLAPEKQKKVVQRWYIEGSYRCSQSGHYILSNSQDKSQLFLDQISQNCSGYEWKEKLYKKLYPISEYQTKIKTSHITSNTFQGPVIRLPRRSEVEAYDDNAQREYPNSLHHIVWVLLNYKNVSDFKCTLFDMLMPTVTNSGPEALSKIDVYAFAYCAALSAKQKHNQKSHIVDDKPCTIPANITDLLCGLTQMKWWDCAYKFCQNELGTELTDIRATLSAGIEVVRCIDNHGLDPELLCLLGRIFSEQAKLISEEQNSNKLEMRAFLYYSSAIPLLNQLKNNIVVKMPKKRIFEYTHSEFGSTELNTLIEECKLYVALTHLRNGEFEKVIDLLANIKSPKALYYLAETYKRIALEEIANSRDTGADTKCMSLFMKSKQFAYNALDKLKQTEAFKSTNLYSETQDLIEDIEACINKVDQDYSTVNNIEEKYLSHENISMITSEQFPLRPNHHFRSISSTPKHQSQANITNYRSAIDSQLLDNNRIDNQYLEKIETHIRNLQKRDATINEFMEQTKRWFKENNTMGNQIINTIHLNAENTTEQFKLLKISIDQVKGQIDECKNDCKDVVDLKKQVAELKKEVLKLKKGPSDPTGNDSDLYNLDENYRTTESTSTFTPHIPFTPPQVIPPFTQRLVPPFPMPSNPYNFYGQNLYSLYNQYSQFTQPQSVPGGPLFDPSRGQMNYSNVYPTPDQMYLDAHLIPPNMSSASTLPPVPTMLIASTVPVLSSTVVTTSVSKAPLTTTIPILKPTHTVDIKEPSRSLPVNVVITSSDPLPTSAAIPAPVLSVTVPLQHIKGSPHNYQIPMPTTTESKALSPPKIDFTQGMNKQTVTTNSSSIWNPSIFADTQSTSLFSSPSQGNSNAVGSVLFGSSPNTSLNKSRTLSEKSNTSVENYDPCPDFKPIIPLPAEVMVTTGEEDEVVIFSARAKLFRFVDKQWKERGLGEMKLLQHKLTGKVRVLMRREQIHKICANHIILPEMEIKPMMKEAKTYFWVANDFAEETVIFEKFCIRFKTAEIGKQFFDTFETARREAIAASKSTQSVSQNLPENSQGRKHNLDQNKTVVGGFTFSNTPSFKIINNVTTSEALTTPQVSKSNVFSTLSFKPNTSTNFSNLFNTTTKQSDSVAQNQQPTEKNKLNTSDTVEEFEPAVDFKPIVPLPALVDQKTGEEDEIVLFEHRAKLLRYDSAAKEWKERGLGNIKLLMHKGNNHKIRLLMRREQIMKVCCNHAVSKEITFQKMPNMDKAVTWCAKDFSEGELVSETFCLRFKTVQICDEFLKAVVSALSKIDESKASNDGNNVDKQSYQTNGDKINPPQIDTSSSWGDKFKPKPGCWECKTCYIQNKADAVVCCACNTSKDPTTTPDPKPITNSENKYSFVMPNKTNSVLSGWGDKFKPKEGSWECDVCLVRNNSDVTECSACNKPRHQNTVTKDNKLIDQNITLKENKSIYTNNVPSSKFTFGISANDEKTAGSETNTFSTNPTQKFTFGFPSVISFGDQKTNTNVFGEPKSVDKEQPLIFSIKNNDSKVSSSLKTSENETNVVKGFGFTYKPPQIEDKSKDTEKNQFVSIEEVKVLKDVEGVSEEGNETLIFGKRVNLSRYVSGKFDKYGLCLVQILKCKENYRLRLKMLQQQFANLCFNYNLTSEVECKPEDENTWLLTINDCSEGESRVEIFCLKFPNAEIALKFNIAFNVSTTSQAEYGTAKKENESDDVVFVGEIQASDEDKQKAIELKLPENFYTYKSKPPCQGCRGCNEDDGASETTCKSMSTALSNTAVGTPVKGSKQSPTNSSYGTPTNLNETADVSIFRTPLGSVGSNTMNTSNVTSKDSMPTETSSSGLAEHKLTFGTSNISCPQPSSIAKKSILAPPKLDAVKSNVSIENKTIEDVNKPIHSSAPNKSIFDFSSNKKDLFQKNSEVKSIFGDDQKPINLFSGTSQGSLFGPSALKGDGTKLVFSPFSSQTQPFKDVVAISSLTKDAARAAAETEPQSTDDAAANEDTSSDAAEIKTIAALKVDNELSFAALSSNASGFNIQQQADFKWEGAGQQLFNSKVNKDKSQENVESAAEEYDPHYEPIVPLPAKIVVTTGEEDEVKLFGDRCKLFRYDEKGREWKERGVGEIKLLFHPKQMTYRLLLRREQVHKLVLNMLLFMDLQLLPMKNSNRAWTWAGVNYGDESAAGDPETMAVRFKTPEIANNFHDKVVECVRTLQAAAAQAIRDEIESSETKQKVAPLQVSGVPQIDTKTMVEEKCATRGQEDKDSETGKQPVSETKQVHFEETEESDCVEEDEGHDYGEEDEDYDHYQHSYEYNEEEEEDDTGIYFSCEGEAIIEKGGDRESCAQANIQVLFDQNLYSPKILVTDSSTGEVLADTLIFIDTEFQLNGDSCSWSGVGDDVNNTYTINFPDNETAVYFYDSCETSKTATCSSMDNES